jgi:hypothetical protein
MATGGMIVKVALVWHGAVSFNVQVVQFFP